MTGVQTCALPIWAVTVRDRDTMEQERVKIADLDSYFADKFSFEVIDKN